jgi:hypothetical protein
MFFDGIVIRGGILLQYHKTLFPGLGDSNERSEEYPAAIWKKM